MEVLNILNTFKDRYGDRINTTVNEEQKEKEDYYPPSPQYLLNSPYPVVTTTLVPVPETAHETVQETAPDTVPEKKTEENQKMEEDAKDN